MKLLGEFYKEKILSRGDLITKARPGILGEIKIERDLFGWLLYVGKKSIQCRSEEEARYLKTFFETGMMEVSVPTDDQYLQSVLPELESLKAKHDRVINDFLESIVSRRIREELKSKVWTEVISRKDDVEDGLD